MLGELINFSAFCGHALYDPATGQPVSESRLAEILPRSLAALELSAQRFIPVPDELSQLYARYRPTPLFDAREFSAALGGRTQILVKDEGSTPSGNHKMNSALWIAYHCSKDGLTTITTETTGNWGIALALAARRFGIRIVCFIDRQSAQERPDREREMRRLGAEVVVVDDPESEYDPLVLSANRAVEYTSTIKGARYIFGSVYNYFIVPQTMTGIEARAELGVDSQPDVVIGSCGGGANLLGIAGAFLLAAMENGGGPAIVCAEAEQCPIVSKGTPGRYSIDDQGYYPLLETYGLPSLLSPGYIGGLGSTLVAAPVARFHQAGLIRTTTLDSASAAAAADLFAATEGRRVALETSYQLAAVINEIRERHPRRILVNISTVGHGSSA
jgi:tryptophan synthase beta chain